MIKTRQFEDSNYRAIWYDGKTIRIALDPNKPITELEYPEFYDVKITGYCQGECPWCYMDSKKTDSHYENIVQKINEFFGPMNDNERPFQVAIGGGEPTSHPDFTALLAEFKLLGIEPNYTTNGMFMDDELALITKDLCGGVAVSCHPHLIKYWEKAAKTLVEFGVRLNFHIIISDRKSIDEFSEIYQKWNNEVEYFVLLPYGNQGRAIKKEINWEYLLEKLTKNTSQIAFGADFYPYLLQGGHNIKVSLYEPEIMSKYLDLSDMKLYPSSFNLIQEKI
jgi:organic radical activating enzyme